jgi:hypothetical protein
MLIFQLIKDPVFVLKLAQYQKKDVVAQKYIISPRAWCIIERY